MRIFEPHIHMYSRTTNDYESMSLCGIEAVVEPAFWLGSDRQSPYTYFDYFTHMLEFEPRRAGNYGISHYSCVAVNPKEANNKDLALEVVDGLGRYLDHPRCVALGEVGFDRITDAEEEVFRKQLSLAQHKGMPVVVHTPHVNKRAGTERIVSVLKNMGLNPGSILIDHNVEDTIEIALNYGGWAGMTIYPGKITPERAIAIMRKYGTERFLINSSADWGVSDPISVPRTCLLMKEAGFTEDQIKKVVWDNPFRFYSLSGKLQALV